MCKKVHSRLYRLLLESVEFETLAPASENIAESKHSGSQENHSVNSLGVTIAKLN